MARSKENLPGGVRTADLVSLGVLSERIPRSTIVDAVGDCGRSSQRRRDLPAELVALFCMSLWLWRDVCCEDVLRCVLESCRWLGLPGSDGATKGAITQARNRLGVEPMRLLFERVAVPVATKDTLGAWYKDKRIVAADGTLFDAPDSPKNGPAFGYPTNQSGRGPFPKVRVVALVESSTHVPFGCAIGSYTDSETELFRQLLHKLTPQMLLLLDRYYFSPDLWQECEDTGAMLLWRIKKDAPVDVIEKLSDGSYLVRIRPTGKLARMVVYTVEGSDERIRIITNQLDPDEAPAIELAQLYPQRWEAELCFDEIKSHICEARLALRSMTPELVRQEIWGLMLLHWALRDLMHDAAQTHARDPDTISFVTAVRLVKLHLAKDGPFSP